MSPPLPLPYSSRRASRAALDDVAYPPSSASSSDTPSYHSRRVLAHVLARKERDTKQMHQLLKLTFAKLDEESQRATDAERRAAECLVRARAAVDARAQSDADAATARSELALYKLQLEQAQREIFRAQELLDGLETRRHDAEEDAARARSVARKLQEERAIEAAREEGKEQGWHEGLRQGMLLGRREAENQLGSRRREENDLPSRSRPRHGTRPDDTHLTQVSPEPIVQSSSEGLSPDDLPPRDITGTRNGSRRPPDIAPLAQAPTVPIRSTPYRHGPEPSNSSNPTLRRHNITSEEQLEQQYDAPQPPHSRQQSRSRSRSRLGTPALEPARSRPYTPHDDSTPSIIQPIPVLASAASSVPVPLPASPSPTRVHHTPVQIPPDNWIPRAQDAAGDGLLSIFLPPPHELTELVRVPEGPYAIAATPEDGSPAVVPPPPDLSPSPPYHYVTPPPPDLGPAVRTTRPFSRNRDHAYAATPPPPELGPATRARDHASPPPPPDLGPASNDRLYAAPQRIAKIASNHSRASTHLSDFDLLAPVDQPPHLNIGPSPAEEDELEYIDAPTEPIPRQQIVRDPPPQRRRATGKRPSRGPSRPRNAVPTLLSQVAEQLVGPPPPSAYVTPQHGSQSQPYMPPLNAQDDDDAPLQVVSERNRPHRSRTQSSGVIGISVEPPSPDDSPPSSGNNRLRRPDLLSPEHAEHPLPMPTIETLVARNKPQPTPPQQRHEERPLTPLPDLADFPPGFVPAPASGPSSSTDELRQYATRAHARGTPRYEAAPVPDGIEYPPSPLQDVARARSIPGKAIAAQVREGEAPLSPLSVSSGLFNLKSRLPWRRNTAK
ncbi:hypothetical protein BJV78DRAFT_1279415 [Lactifluus subvellereus]|nr:hypothetical protein BJV78DRAFT_1279415 [Lactifluus subvellereus]